MSKSQDAKSALEFPLEAWIINKHVNYKLKLKVNAFRQSILKYYAASYNFCRISDFNGSSILFRVWEVYNFITMDLISHSFSLNYLGRIAKSLLMF